LGPPDAPSPPDPWTSAWRQTIAVAARVTDPERKKERCVNPQEMVRVQAYMRKVFGAKTLSVRARPKIKDSAEVYVGEDFVGTLTVDNEDGELCYQFQMAILEMDLEDA
jgi:hypothetical protein